MAKKEPIAVPALPAPANPLSRAVRIGELVFLSGTGGRNPETNEFGQRQASLLDGPMVFSDLDVVEDRS